MGNASLKTKIIGLPVGVFIAALIANIAWTDYAFRQQMENELQERGEIVALQMKQTWNYLVEMSDVPDGGTAPVYYTMPEADNCAVAGRELSLTFTDASDYITRYVSDQPRNLANLPDGFEEGVIAAFRDDPSRTWYGTIVDADGTQIYRYAEPMLVTEICLDCHGGPKSAIDATATRKKGFLSGRP